LVEAREPIFGSMGGAVVTATGIINGKTITLDEALGLPDGSPVRVHVESRRVRPELTIEEKLALVEQTWGSIPATREQIREVLEEDPYGVE